MQLIAAAALLPHCRFCGEVLRQSLVDLGATPLANALLTPAQAAAGADRAWPLHVRVCERCLLVQVDIVVPPAEIFSDYPYFSSVASSWVAHAARFCDEVCARFGLDGRSRVVEIASNDGYLLQHFVARGVPVLGVEPAANVAAAARARGIATEIGFFDEAFAGYDAALKLEPQLNEVLWNAALAHLVLGDLPTGFAKYESRWQNKLAQQNKRQFPRPLWLGDTPLAGKTLLLYAEQGFGDTLQFIRYATLAAAQGARVIVETQPALKRLVAGVPGVSAVFGQGEPLSAYDLRCPLMSLPLAFGTTLDTIPATLPYLAAPADAVARWRARFDGARARVGLVFSGNPEHKNDRNRSIPLMRLAPVVNTPGVRFVCLQKDVRPADAATLQQMPQIETVAAELTDFTDTAALIETLDLVVTV
ncbi:MAG: hypothetical protein J0I21_18775, partial [Alphaproteobacteria bacterium]|nr:hypothetical protein [Alphaproteobacteria bacterium]